MGANWRGERENGIVGQFLPSPLATISNIMSVWILHCAIAGLVGRLMVVWANFFPFPSGEFGGNNVFVVPSFSPFQKCRVSTNYGFIFLGGNSSVCGCDPKVACFEWKQSISRIISCFSYFAHPRLFFCHKYDTKNACLMRSQKQGGGNRKGKEENILSSSSGKQEENIFSGKGSNEHHLDVREMPACVIFPPRFFSLLLWGESVCLCVSKYLFLALVDFFVSLFLLLPYPFFFLSPLFPNAVFPPRKKKSFL